MFLLVLTTKGEKNMKLNRKNLSENGKDSVKTSGCGCGCGTKHGAAAGEYEEIEETEIKVSK
jgi:hypothetical protein